MAVPSGKFCIPIPIDRINAGIISCCAHAKATPTAKPSGILCNVIANINN